MESPCLCSSEGPTNICFFPPSKLPSRLTHIFWFVKFILASSLVPSTLHPKKSFSPLIPLNVLVHPTPKKLKRFFFSHWKRIKCFPFTLHRRNSKTGFTLRKYSKSLLFTLRRRNLKMQQSKVILDLCSRKNTDREIVFEMICFQNCFCLHGNAKSAFLNSSGLNSVYEKLCFREGFRCVFKFLQRNVSGRSLRLKLPWISVRLSLRCIEDLAWLLRARKFLLFLSINIVLKYLFKLLSMLGTVWCT